jgi:phage host-nuclease inhibitor protein Gam
VVRSWQECDETLRRIALIDVTVKKAEALRDAELVKVKTKFSGATAEVAAERAELAEQVEAFAKTQKKALAKEGRKSIEMHFGRVGWRLATPAVKPKAGWKLPQVFAALKAMFDGPMLLKLIRVSESLRKDQAKDLLTPEQMEQAGLRVVAPERFFIEPFTHKVPTPQV